MIRNAPIVALVTSFIGGTAIALELGDRDIEGSELHVIESSGQLPQREQTAAFLDAVSPFLSRTTPGK